MQGQGSQPLLCDQVQAEPAPRATPEADGVKAGMLHSCEAQLLLQGQEGSGGQAIPDRGHAADAAGEGPQQSPQQRRSLLVSRHHPVRQPAADSLPEMHPPPAGSKRLGQTYRQLPSKCPMYRRLKIYCKV